MIHRGPVSGHLSIPPRRSWKCIRRPSTLPVSQGTGGSLFPSVRATRSDSFCATWKRQTRARPGKKEAYQPPLKSEQRKKLSVEKTDYIHFTACTMHSMFRGLFGVPHLFARELLMNSPHSKIATSFSKSSGPRFDRLDWSRMIKEKVLER